ncbi:MAG: hypothetical protein AAFP19_26725 [Bacteroidota bacterium]
MLPPIDHEIEELIRQYQGMIQATSYLHKLREEVNKEQKRLHSIDRLLQKSEDKIASIERPYDLRQMFKNLIGQKTQLLEIERERHYDLLIKYNTGKDFIESAQFEMDILTEKVSQKSEIKRQLKLKLKERTEQVQQSKNPHLTKILDINEQVDHLIGLKKEVEEAQTVGEHITEHLTATLDFLHSKRQKRHGLYPDKKQIYSFNIEELDRFREQTVKMRQLLIAYDSEVRDIYEYMKLHTTFRLTQGINFTDDYLDAIKTDFVLSRNLDASITFIEMTNFRIKKRQVQFEKDIQYLENDIRGKRAYKEELIENYDLKN